MAEDAFELLDSLGWTSDRQLHVIGISMGGMIAQEMAFKQPERVASLSLVSTASHLVNTVGFVANLRQRINLFIPKGLDVQLAEIKKNLFSEDWLAAPDAEGNFPTNGDRVAAQEVKKRQDTEAFTRKGFLLQAIATGWHHKSPEQMREIGDKVGRERIQVLHGTIDNMITVPHGETLVKELGGEESGVTRKVFEGRGHVLPIEERREFGKLIEQLVVKTQGRSSI
ncbi:hypothetical protein MMC13_003570 [Lambiella insularis]|nr:hypothetical protein [Lambiella insularis]